MELLGEEVGRARSESGERVRELEGRVREQSDRLAAYQKIETEIDDVVLQAAQGQFFSPPLSSRDPTLLYNRQFSIAQKNSKLRETLHNVSR